MNKTYTTNTINFILLIYLFVSDFQDLLPEIKQAISSATFIAIDCEMTGLHIQGLQINAYDTQKEYYEKMQSACKKFLVIQYGICCFR